MQDGLRRFGLPDLQAALVAIDPVTGNVLALVGGRDYQRSAFNRASRSRRQPGSAFKPFLFAAALERGYSPVSTLSGLGSRSSRKARRNGRRGMPAGASDVMTLRAALFESNNRAATMLQQHVGSAPRAERRGQGGAPRSAGRAVAVARHRPGHAARSHRRLCDFPERRPCGAPARHHQGRGRRRRHGPRGSPSETERAITPQVAYQMVTMLSDVMNRGTASSARRLGVTFPTGGKTGTTDDFKDAWFVGFSSSLVVGVWVGFDQPKTIAADGYGARYALPDLGRLHAARGARAAPGRVRTAIRAAGRNPVPRCRTCGRWTAARSTPSSSRTATRFRAGCAHCIVERSGSVSRAPSRDG